MTPRLRFAPSPTGYLHVGGARTALVQLALRPPPRRDLHPSHRGHRHPALVVGDGERHPRRAQLAGDRLGRGTADRRPARAVFPVRAAGALPGSRPATCCRKARPSRTKAQSASRCRPVRRRSWTASTGRSSSTTSISRASSSFAPTRTRRITCRWWWTTSTWRSRTSSAATITSRTRRSRCCSTRRSGPRRRRSRTCRSSWDRTRSVSANVTARHR